MTTQIELQWQDEPDGDGWYWVEGLFEWSDIPMPWFVYRLEVGSDWVVKDWGLLEHSRVSKIPEPPK